MWQIFLITGLAFHLLVWVGILLVVSRQKCPGSLCPYKISLSCRVFVNRSTCNDIKRIKVRRQCIADMFVVEF